MDVSKLKVIPGRPYPTGTAVYEKGVRFTIFARHASQVWLALYDGVEALEPVWEYAFDPENNRTGDVWSIFVRGLGEGVYYKYRMDGPRDPAAGHRYDPSVYLLDPYAKAFAGDIHDGTMKCVTVHDEMDWCDDVRPHVSMKDTVIYETHVRGFTIHPLSGCANGGTYEGIIEKIPYLKELGVTAVELLPIQEFGENLLGRCSIVSGQELINYWGYSSIGFFAPAGRYACSADGLEHLDEFRRMVHALHNAGIEIILDVVFNHTSEGNERGPTLCFRGIDNSIYYILENGGHYANYSGCGNTVNCNHPLVRDFILDCLRYWVAVMHVDGFRFDLASILGRDQDGDVLEDAPLVKRIAEDPVLRNIKLIAEAWDAGGAYQVGSFGGGRWAEWNGRYRDDVRRFWRGESNTRAAFASRLSGSADLYQAAGRSPEHSINFVTCHDGFTLRDLVSYNRKHNEANGEGNRDGTDDNLSFNCGVEGESDDPAINALRLRVQKNHLATLFASLGVPMLLGGDEFGRTQRGNNNAYCQDNAISWLDWRLLDENEGLHRFCREMIAFRKDNPVFSRAEYFTGGPADGENGPPDIVWLEADGTPVTDWHGSETVLACVIDGSLNGDVPVYLAFNNSWQDREFQLPAGSWCIRVHTAWPSPEDMQSQEEARVLHTPQMTLPAHTMVVLTGQPC